MSGPGPDRPAAAGFVPPARPLGLFAARRRDQGRRHRRTVRARGHAGGGAERPRQPVRRAGVLPVHEGQGRPAGGRLRPAGVGDRRGTAGALGPLPHPGVVRQGRGRLAEPLRPVLPGLPGSAGRRGAVRALARGRGARRGADPALRRSGRPGRSPVRRRSHGRGRGGAGRHAGGLRRPLLRRAAAPRRGGRSRRRAGPGRLGLRQRRAAGRHQRRLFRRRRPARGPRRAALRRRRFVPGRGGPAPRQRRALVQARRRHARGLRRPAGGLRQHPGDRAALRLPGLQARSHPAALRHRRRPLGGRGAGLPGPRGPARALGRPPAGGGRGRLLGAAGARDRRHHPDGLSRLLPDRRRLHQVVQGQRHPRRSGARLRGRLAGGLRAHHHQPRPPALRVAVRAVPQPRAGLDARLRHRFLPGAARPDHRLRPAEVRQGPRRPDHHLRHPAGARGAARRRPGDAAATRPGRPAGQDGAGQPRQPGDPGPGAGDRAPAAAGAPRRPRPSRPCSTWP